ncbi:hypothetical protein VTH06DRAFT_5004 [Thermothelomyces fergusii]
MALYLLGVCSQRAKLAFRRPLEAADVLGRETAGADLCASRQTTADHGQVAGCTKTTGHRATPNTTPPGRASTVRTARGGGSIQVALGGRAGSSASTTTVLIYCCNCTGESYYNAAIQVQCVECHHVPCNYCKRETLRIPSGR